MNQKVVECRSCKASIFFIRTPKGKAHPVDAKSVRIWTPANRGGRDAGFNPSDPRDVTPEEWIQVEGYQSHFATCPDADRFRGPRDGNREAKDGNR